ncbi:hypothetical protein SDC9_135994 [bioreactor metagenome]|uniref:Uncharacterized protein n=1 Tax=bioreactor metagenome TaxID=1076179 RepID=A0A645DHC9_9ZZZZ
MAHPGRPSRLAWLADLADRRCGRGHPARPIGDHRGVHRDRFHLHRAGYPDSGAARRGRSAFTIRAGRDRNRRGRRVRSAARDLDLPGWTQSARRNAGGSRLRDHRRRGDLARLTLVPSGLQSDDDADPAHQRPVRHPHRHFPARRFVGAEHRAGPGHAAGCLRCRRPQPSAVSRFGARRPRDGRGEAGSRGLRFPGAGLLHHDRCHLRPQRPDRRAQADRPAGVCGGAAADHPRHPGAAGRTARFNSCRPRGHAALRGHGAAHHRRGHRHRSRTR